MPFGKGMVWCSFFCLINQFGGLSMFVNEQQFIETRTFAMSSLYEAKNLNRYLRVECIGNEELTLGKESTLCLKVVFENIFGYIPLDLVDEYNYKSLDSFTNKQFDVMIKDIITTDTNLYDGVFFVADRKAANAMKVEQFWKRVETGQIYDALVTGVDSMFVFLNVHGVKLRMHKSDYSHTYIHDLNSEISLNETPSIRVRIMEVDKEKRDVHISKKALEMDPIQAIGTYKPGGTYGATINNIDLDRKVIFVTLKPYGLTALAQLPTANVARHIKNGSEVLFKVVDVDVAKGHVRGRISLPYMGQIARSERRGF